MVEMTLRAFHRVDADGSHTVAIGLLGFLRSDPDVIQPGVVSFVFVRPKPIAQNDPSPKR
jgi:hypothetical protein